MNCTKIFLQTPSLPTTLSQTTCNSGSILSEPISLSIANIASDSQLAQEEINEILAAAAEPEGTVEDYLKCANGVIVTNFYKKNKVLESSHRNILANIIITKEFEKLHRQNLPFKISRDRFLALTREIINKFTNENPDLYFVPYNNITKKGASGKLWEVFNYFKKRQKCSEKTESKEFTVVEEETNGESINEKLEFLKKNFEPYEKISDYWRSTARHRLDILKTKTNYGIHDYFQEYPILKGQKGNFLICSDFDYLYPDKGNKLFANWAGINEKLKILAAKKSIPELNPILSSDTNNLAGFYVLPYLLPHAFKKKRSSDSKRTRFTVPEISKAFFLHIKVADYFIII